VNRDGETGYTCDVGDTEQMAEKAKHILGSEDTLVAFKERVFERAKSFDIHKIMPQYEALYESLLSAESV